MATAQRNMDEAVRAALHASEASNAAIMDQFERMLQPYRARQQQQQQQGRPENHHSSSSCSSRSNNRQQQQKRQQRQQQGHPEQQQEQLAQQHRQQRQREQQQKGHPEGNNGAEGERIVRQNEVSSAAAPGPGRIIIIVSFSKTMSTGAGQLFRKDRRGRQCS